MRGEVKCDGRRDPDQQQRECASALSDVDAVALPHPCDQPAGVPAPIVNMRLTGTLGRRRRPGAVSSRFDRRVFELPTLPVPINGTSVPFFVAGRFGFPSSNDGDVTIEARRGHTLVGSVRVMVRVRKNANTLTTGERDRLVAAFAQLNNQGLGRFADFRDMHTAASSAQAHGAPGFLPWHRAYLLDLERELQNIDPSVSLPYWRFDQAAPNIFTRDFFGVSDTARHRSVQSDQSAAVLAHGRRAGHQSRARSSTPRTRPADLRTEAQTLALGTAYPAFRTMEGNPHGSAHTSFGGSISRCPPPRTTRCSSCCTATSIDSGPSGSGRTAASIRRVAASYDSSPAPGRPQPARHDVAVERRHRQAHGRRRLPAAPWRHRRA